MREGTIAILALLCAAGCDGIEHVSIPQHDAGQDAGLDAAPDVDVPTCVCDEPGPCCDGCSAIAVGEPCDDGLECTTASVCFDDGVCRGEPDACDYMLDEPQCQTATCDDVAGCGAVQSIRQGLPCDDGDASTYNDRCDAGACVGEPCECDAESVCCDGCFAINDGATCDDGDPETFGDACSGGECVGQSCECEDGPCCDGCWLLGPGARCDDQIADGWTSCKSAQVLEYQNAFRHCSGTSPACDGGLVWDDVVEHHCSPGRTCAETPYGHQCVES